MYYVTVIGSSGKIPREVEEVAYKLGKLLAKEGFIVVNGGRDGVMEAVSRGAKEGGGITIGILPGTSRFEANKYIDYAIPTGIGHARNAINVLAGDVVVVVHGGPGTLSEVGLALAYGKTVIAIRKSGGVAEIVADKWIGNHYVIGVDSPEEAVEKIKETLVRV